MVEDNSGATSEIMNNRCYSSSSVQQSHNKCILSNNKMEERKCYVSEMEPRRRKEDEEKNTTVQDKCLERYREVKDNGGIMKKFEKQMLNIVMR